VFPGEVDLQRLTRSDREHQIVGRAVPTLPLGGTVTARTTAAAVARHQRAAKDLPQIRQLRAATTWTRATPACRTASAAANGQ
jgi:hypothetical protein